jgi:hypothetical protein
MNGPLLQRSICGEMSETLGGGLPQVQSSIAAERASQCAA